MRRVYVRLASADIARLVRRAQEERRHPADEAALLLSKALRGAGSDRAPAESGAALEEEDGRAAAAS